MSNPTDIVGHKTISDGKGGHYHEPLTRAESEEIWAAVMAAKEKRAADMPDDAAALRAMGEAYQRLQELGWRQWIYMPKDGSMVDLIEAGSTGIHKGYYEGEWPKGRVWIVDDHDTWPSHPILFRAPSSVSATADPQVGTVTRPE